jgi:hypothetical protein
MNFWKKIVKTFKDSPLSKGGNLNISQLVKKPATYINKISKLTGMGGKNGGTGFNIPTMAKGLTQKLKSSTFAFRNKLSKTAKSLNT